MIPVKKSADSTRMPFPDNVLKKAGGLLSPVASGLGGLVNRCRAIRPTMKPIR